MITDPTTITVNSFQMIRRELGSRAAGFSPAELSIVERVIHSTADFEFVETLAWSENAIQAGVQALVLEPEVARALRTKAYEAGWAGIDKSSPKYAAQLRELFGGYQP
mgnify:CR=1 FL=1